MGPRRSPFWLLISRSRIVVVDGRTRRPLFLVYSPLDTNSWTVASVIEQTEIGKFPTLYAALSFVRPVRILHPIAALEAMPNVSEAWMHRLVY